MLRFIRQLFQRQESVSDDGSDLGEHELHHINEGRSGYIIYRDAAGEINMYYEYGGANCIVAINVPTPDEWATRLNRKPEDRDRILNFIARHAIRYQTPGSGYTLSNRFIEVY